MHGEEGEVLFYNLSSMTITVKNICKIGNNNHLFNKEKNSLKGFL